jgi:hypothetical protein
MWAPAGCRSSRTCSPRSVPLQSSKTVSFVTLPNVSSGVGVFTAMHVFAIGLGG